MVKKKTRRKKKAVEKIDPRTFKGYIRGMRISTRKYGSGVGSTNGLEKIPEKSPTKAVKIDKIKSWKVI